MLDGDGIDDEVKVVLVALLAVHIELGHPLIDVK
jgi:hypothetical protein